MIIKSFSLTNIKNINSSYILLYGDNEGHKNDVINDFFLKNFKGEIIKYDESQILEKKELFIETCFNESLFENSKIIIINRVTNKLYELINSLIEKKIHEKKIIFNSGILEKKSKLRILFEKKEDLVCIPFYQDNNISLFRIANEFFKKNNILISSENINLVVEKSSGDRKNLYNELDKILNFCFQKKRITREEIIKLINFHEDGNYFELIDNCLAGNQVRVNKIINNSIYSDSESIILIRSFISRLKRLIELKKLQKQFGNVKDAIANFKPPIFWKDKEIVEKQIKLWSSDRIYTLIDEVNNIEIKQKKNSNISNNLIFDLILNNSSN